MQTELLINLIIGIDIFISNIENIYLFIFNSVVLMCLNMNVH